MAKAKKRSTVITGNWKMHKTVPETIAFIQELILKVSQASSSVYIAVPFTSIKAAVETVVGSSIVIGAQNMNDVSEGAFTGEIAGKMLQDVGARFVILGHSERRRIFGEDNAFVNRKVKRALADMIQPLVCVGETLAEREANQTEEILKKQLVESLADIAKLETVMIAYEPVWAIGTGQTATPKQAQAAHAFCREVISKQWGKEAGEKIVIQYGGSVKPDNAKSLLEQSDIDGLLVGGASLSVDTFSEIINSAN